MPTGVFRWWRQPRFWRMWRVLLAVSVRGVHALIPNGADPHSYEPSLRDVRDVAYARLAFTNGLLLEQRKMVAMVSSNLPQGSAQVAVPRG